MTLSISLMWCEWLGTPELQGHRCDLMICIFTCCRVAGVAGVFMSSCCASFMVVDELQLELINSQ